MYSHLLSASVSEGENLGFQTMLEDNRGLILPESDLRKNFCVLLPAGILMPCASELQGPHTKSSI